MDESLRSVISTMKINWVIQWIIIYPPFEQLGKISKEEQFSVDKVPTQGKYLIENDSIGPPATQKIP